MPLRFWLSCCLSSFALSQVTRKGAITHFPDSGNYVMLTFDDGPHQIITPLVLDILRSKNVQATFYVVGMKVALHPEIVQRIHREGHDVANHG